MEDTLKETTPPAATPAKPLAQWIVGATVIAWVMYCGVMAQVSLDRYQATYQDATGADVSFTGMFLKLFAILPGFPALVIDSLVPNIVCWIAVIALSAAFLSAEVFAWRYRITRLAVTLAAWLAVNMVIVAVVSHHLTGDGP